VADVGHEPRTLAVHPRASHLTHRHITSSLAEFDFKQIWLASRSHNGTRVVLPNGYDVMYGSDVSASSAFSAFETGKCEWVDRTTCSTFLYEMSTRHITLQVSTDVVIVMYLKLLFDRNCCVYFVVPLFCKWSLLCASLSHTDGPFFLLCVSVCGPVCALVYPTVIGRSSCCVCLYVVPSVR
jgi:hypothetical protein